MRRQREESRGSAIARVGAVEGAREKGGRSEIPDCLAKELPWAIVESFSVVVVSPSCSLSRLIYFVQIRAEPWGTEAWSREPPKTPDVLTRENRGSALQRIFVRRQDPLSAVLGVLPTSSGGVWQRKTDAASSVGDPGVPTGAFPWRRGGGRRIIPATLGLCVVICGGD